MMKYCLFVLGVMVGAAMIGASWHDFGQNEATYIVYGGVLVIASSLAGLLASIASGIRREIRGPKSHAEPKSWGSRLTTQRLAD